MSKTTTKNPTPKSTRKSSRNDTPDGSDANAIDAARAEALATLAAKEPATREPTRRAAKQTPPTPTTPTAATKARAPKASAAQTRLSALDAAAQVLSTLSANEVESGLSAQELIDRMAGSGLWASPGGKTPAATLYAAMIREIATKGDASRFMRLEAADGRKRGRFATPHASTSAAAPKRSTAAPRPAKPTTTKSTKPAGTKPAPTKPVRKGGA
jgi:hypothetical protein